MLYASLSRSCVSSLVDLMYLKRWMHAFVSRLLWSGYGGLRVLDRAMFPGRLLQ